MKVFVYCGLPGAGKSTLIGKRHQSLTLVVSADHYFTSPAGSYVYVAAKAKEAHADCLRRFLGHVQTGNIYGRCDVVVDNTNTRVAELAPYVAVAEAYGHETTVITVDAEPHEAWKRNVHGVSLEVVQRMHDQLLARDIPPWWKHERITAEVA
jgi:predicted kinase